MGKRRGACGGRWRCRWRRPRRSEGLGIAALEANTLNSIPVRLLLPVTPGHPAASPRLSSIIWERKLPVLRGLHGLTRNDTHAALCSPARTAVGLCACESVCTSRDQERGFDSFSGLCAGPAGCGVCGGGAV